MEYLAGAISSVVIATLVFIYLIVRMAMKHEERKLSVKSGADQRTDQILAETQAEVAKLRERVQVLERLATDDDSRLAREINRLGDNAATRG